MLDVKHSLCRTCLGAVTQSSAFNIFITEDLANKLILCTGRPVEPTDEYPEQLCLQCYEKTLIFYEFQQLCYKSLETFLDILKSKEECKTGYCKTENYAKDPLKPDPQEQNLLNITSTVISCSQQNKNEPMEKKRSSRPPRKKLEKQKLERTTVIKRSSKIVIQQMVASSVSKDTMKNDLKEYLEFDKDSEICMENANSSANQVALKKQWKPNFVIEDAIDSNKDEYSKEEAAVDEIHSRLDDGVGKSIPGQGFKCDLDNCERVYKNKSNLNVHKRKFHNFGPKLKTHMCEICGKVFKSSAVLTDHRYTHFEKTQLPYACEEAGCSKRFSNKEKLKIHKMRHAGIKNFVCPHCGMRKTTRNELKIHINYHTLERTWPCLFCPKVCNSAGNLKMHVKNMHERAKDFACRFCQRTFAKPDTKKYHEMTHTGEKPHECKECGRRFIQPAGLRTHLKIHLRQKGKLAENRKKKQAVTTEEKRRSAENLDEEDLLTESIVAEILTDSNPSYE